MHFDRYSKLQLTDVDHPSLARRVASWIVPAEHHLRLRRAHVGMPSTWTAEQLADDADLSGEAELRVQTRWNAARDVFACRFVHRDARDAAVFWHTVFRVSVVDGVCTVECGVGRSAPRDVVLRPQAYPPRVLVDLLDERDSARVRERALTLPPLDVRDATDVRVFVDELLLRSDRETPVVVIACDLGGSSALVDVPVLAQKLRGLAVVAALHGKEVTWEYRQELERRDVSGDLACFNGAIHTYGSTRRIGADHQLWLGRSLAALPEHERSERVGETIARRLALAHLPTGFFSLIEEIDRQTRAERASTPKLDAGSTGDVAAALALMDEANARATTKETELRSTLARIEELETRVQQLELDCDVAEKQAENLQEVLEQYKERANTGVLSTELRDAFHRAIVTGAPTPAEALDIIATLFPDRVVVLDAARSSALDASAYLNPRDVFSLLRRLATDFWDRITTTPATAHKAFTLKEYAPDGSESEHNDRRCVEDRTRTYRGKELVMWKHLKAGGNGGPDKCLRIHFEWIAHERKIVIGHCGRHLKEA
jgi:hypothetical protein